MMKKTSFLIFVIVGIVNMISIAQNKQNIDAYKIEADGYFTNISVSEYGIVATDNYASKLYLIQNGQMKILLSAAGCGRYYTLSPDKKKIGFKHITSDGKQTPAILDILTKKITPLHPSVDLCGQVSFSNNGTIAFTVLNMLYILTGNNSQTYDLGTYSNNVQLSPDATMVIFNDNSDQLIIINLLSGQRVKITDNIAGCVYPKWSHDGTKIIFNSISGDLFVYALQTEQVLKLDDKSGNALWSDNSEFIIYQKNYSTNFEFHGTDIFKINSDATAKINLTNTTDINEMSPYIYRNNLYYHTYEKREIIKTFFSSDLNDFESKTVMLTHNDVLPISYHIFTQSNKSIVRIPGVVPYVHQVYDTPDWHYGYGSCAPTTSVMAFAYFNLLPKWPVQTDNGAGVHTNDYGAYVADKYRFREVYYQDVSATGGGEDAFGGYGYLWTGSYSPNSRMKTYIENHGLTSNQLWTTSCTYANTITEIDLGYPHPICNYLTSAGHLTLAIGYLSTQHTLIFNDPYGNKNNPGYPNINGVDAYYDWPGYNNGYVNLDPSGSYGGVAWTVRTRGTEVTYNDTIIDDVFYNHGFYMNNSQNSSTQRYFRDQITGGYNDHFWFTGTMVGSSDICYVTWTPTIADAGNYEVLTYIPGGANSNAAGAIYKIYHSLGTSNVVVDQSQYSGQWVSLGTYNLEAGQNSYIYLGDSTGIASQMIAFDAMRFNKIGTTDNIAPTTLVTTSGVWMTEDFTTFFSDQDNAGGSGVEKGYYQILDFDGQYWGANSDHGFFADNFDVLNTSIWASPVNGGTWNTTNGLLYQSDSTITNTNFYALLNQNLSNRYLYHFTAKIESEPYGINQRRFGFHFFCDTGNTLNRSNSYFIFFRQETSKLEFYKVENNISTQVKVVDNVVTNIGNIYDYKIIFDRITGKISVYRDDVFLSSWTDSAPLTTLGNYISFRTGNCKISVSELKVFRSRNSNVNVTLGNANADIRYQNINPLISSAKIKSIVTDSTGNLSVVAFHDLNIDWTVPANVNVSDGLSIDIDTTSIVDEISANWTTSADMNSDIYRYMFAVGTSPGSADIINWTDNGTATSFTQNGFSLQNGQYYYISVFAENYAGLISGISVSDGIYIVNLPVAGFFSGSQNVCQGDTIYYINVSSNATSYQWMFEGGMPAQSTDENPIVVYNTNGIFDVKLIAEGQGGTDSIIQNDIITVNPQTEAMFYTNAISGTAPLLVLFNNTSMNSEGFIWYFGEGNSVSDINPYHIYNNAGDFNVTLVSLNSNCGNDTAYVSIHVDPFVGIYENIMNNSFIIFSNPLSQQISIEYEIAEAGNINLTIYDILGKEVSVLVNEEQAAGKHKLNVNSNDLSSGIYFCKMQAVNEANNWNLTRKMKIVK